MSKTKDPKWSDVKKVLSACSERDLLGLIGELYSMSKEAKRFLNTRFCNHGLDEHKEIIRNNLYPDVTRDQPIRFAPARKAISEYKKATGNVTGTVDLMVYYVECGNDFACDYGDMYEDFYISLESMFEKVLAFLSKYADIRDVFIQRLECVVKKADGMGWGYYDAISDMLEEWKKQHECVCS